MKAMISQSMVGKTDEEIRIQRKNAELQLKSLGYEIVNASFDEDVAIEKGAINIPLCFMAAEVENMGKCDAVLFCNGFEDARECRIELEVAINYGLKIIYEDMADISIQHTEEI